jgi:hypothetical protein
MLSEVSRCPVGLLANDILVEILLHISSLSDLGAFARVSTRSRIASEEGRIWQIVANEMLSVSSVAPHLRLPHLPHSRQPHFNWKRYCRQVFTLDECEWEGRATMYSSSTQCYPFTHEQRIECNDIEANGNNRKDATDDDNDDDVENASELTHNSNTSAAVSNDANAELRVSSLVCLVNTPFVPAALYLDYGTNRDADCACMELNASVRGQGHVVMRRARRVPPQQPKGKMNKGGDGVSSREQKKGKAKSKSKDELNSLSLAYDETDLLSSRVFAQSEFQEMLDQWMTGGRVKLVAPQFRLSVTTRAHSRFFSALRCIRHGPAIAHSSILSYAMSLMDAVSLAIIFPPPCDPKENRYTLSLSIMNFVDSL